MLESFLRTPYQKFFADKLGIFLGQFFTPWHITLLAMVAGIMAAVCFALHAALLGCLLLLFSGMLDTLDGTIARHYEITSHLGALFDITADRIVESALVLALLFTFPDKTMFIFSLFALMLICITVFLSVGIFSQNNSNKSFYYQPGIIERCEFIIFIGLLNLLPTYFNGIILTILTLLILTIILHIFSFIKFQKMLLQ